MPRIIAGALGGRTVPGPPGSATRPTADRVREAVFSRLDGWGELDGARVLDLFAGTGALAFEALSRGAESALLVEAHPRTAARIARTVDELGLADRARVRTARAASLVQDLAVGTSDRFSLVFLDPPYEMPTLEVEELLVALRPALTADAVAVIERSVRSRPVAWPTGYAGDGTKTYGETVIAYGGPTEGPAAAGASTDQQNEQEP